MLSVKVLGFRVRPKQIHAQAQADPKPGQDLCMVSKVAAFTPRYKARSGMTKAYTGARILPDWLCSYFLTDYMASKEIPT